MDTVDYDGSVPLPLLTDAEIGQIVDGEWIRHGACTMEGAPPVDGDEQAFKAACRTCPVETQCLLYGLVTGATDMIYGGRDVEERKPLDRGQRYSICERCSAGFTWTKAPRRPGPSVCSTCNGTKRSTHYSYGATHA